MVFFFSGYFGYQLVFESWNFFGAAGDVAIDDLKFTDCAEPLPPPSCPSNSFKCSSGHCVPNDNKCDFESDCCDYSDETEQLCSNYLR